MLGAPIHPEGESQDEHGDPLGDIRLLFLFLFFPLFYSCYSCGVCIVLTRLHVVRFTA